MDVKKEKKPQKFGWKWNRSPKKVKRVHSFKTVKNYSKGIKDICYLRFCSALLKAFLTISTIWFRLEDLEKNMSFGFYMNLINFLRKNDFEYISVILNLI